MQLLSCSKAEKTFGLKLIYFFYFLISLFFILPLLVFLFGIVCFIYFILFIFFGGGGGREEGSMLFFLKPCFSFKSIAFFSSAGATWPSSNHEECFLSWICSSSLSRHSQTGLLLSSALKLIGAASNVLRAQDKLLTLPKLTIAHEICIHALVQAQIKAEIVSRPWTDWRFCNLV